MVSGIVGAFPLRECSWPTSAAWLLQRSQRWWHSIRSYCPLPISAGGVSLPHLPAPFHLPPGKPAQKNYLVPTPASKRLTTFPHGEIPPRKAPPPLPGSEG